MNYTLTWHVPQKALYVRLEDQLTLKILQAINDELKSTLDDCQSKIMLILDLDELKANYQTTDLMRTTLTMVDHANLDGILVLTENKLNRLISLMAFGMLPILTKQFPTRKELNDFLEQRNILERN